MGNIMVFPTAAFPGWPFAHPTPGRQDGLNIVFDSHPAGTEFDLPVSRSRPSAWRRSL